MIRGTRLGGAILVALVSSACMYPSAMGDPVSAPTCGPQDDRSSTVRWIHPARERDVRSLADWCISVGPPELSLSPAGARPPGETDTGGGPRAPVVSSADVVVVSWNVQGRAGDIAGFLRDQLSYDCSTRSGSQHFVVMVQEGVRRSLRVPASMGEYPPALGSVETNHRPDFVVSARDCGLSFVYVPSMRNGAEGYIDGHEDRGNAILSSLPLANPSAIELPFEGQRRVAVMASIEAPERRDTVTFVSLHLDSFSGIARTLFAGATSKERQVLGLIDALALGESPGAISPWSGHTILVAGDLNTWSERQTVVKRLIEHFPDSPPVDNQPTRGWFPTDHVFAIVRDPRGQPAGGHEFETPQGHLTVDASSYELIPDTYLSDHKPRRLRLTNSH